jgi:hypothetical protein
VQVYDALYIAGYIALAFIGICWLAEHAAEWLAERIKHD